MGVHGLWKLLEPAGKPIPLESLENKVLAVDVSIWLYQLTKGLQTTGGGVVPNAHILGLFNRVCKLLYYRIKPVFVFDGGVPLLKKETIDTRKKLKLKAKDSSEKLREKLLENLLKQKALNQLLGSEEDVGICKSVENDIFVLPPLPQKSETDDSDEECDTEVNSVKIDSFCNYQYGKDVHSIDITSEYFKSLPPEIRHEILSELQETRKQSSWARIHEMPEESSDFSKYQMARLMKRRNVQKSLDIAAQEMGGRTMTMSELETMFAEDNILVNALPGKRIASDNVTRYILIKGKSEKNKNQERLHDDVDVKIEENTEKAPETLSQMDDVEESEFRKNLYSIDQCMFADDSSSDDDVRIIKDNLETDLVSTLSSKENISQEEILKLIQEQNLTNENIKFNKSETKEKQDTIDENIEKNSHITEGSETFSEIKTSPLITSFESRYDDVQLIVHSPESSKNIDSCLENSYKKSLSKLDRMINSVTSGKSNLIGSPCCSKSLLEDNNAHSTDIISESDSDDFVEVTDVEEKSKYFGNTKDTTLEISIDPNHIEGDDMFADVFQPSEKEKSIESQKTTVNVVEFEKQKIEDELKKQKDHIECTENVNINLVEATKGYGSDNVEKKENKDVVTTKNKEKIKKLADIFQSVKKIENKEKINIESKEIDKTINVNDEKLEEVQKMLNKEQTELLFDYGKQERLGSTITEQMIIEAQELLQLFGLPYVVAPMEAEAQCAFLDQISLTEGTITDDSDIWLFGGQKVYKNFFDNRKYVLQFRSIDIDHFFKLSREQLIQMALLVGSDYTVGIEGIGPVTAIEILAYFSDKSNKLENEADIAETLRKFKLWVHNNRTSSSVLARKVKNVHLSEEFPNTAVIDAYMYPTVNESKEGFTWATPDLDRIRQYMKKKFGWKMKRIDEILLPVIKRLSDRNKQTTLDAFLKTIPHNVVDSSTMSKRVIQAINIMKNNVEIDVSKLPPKSPRKKATRKKNSTKVSSKNSSTNSQTTTKNILSSPHKPQTSNREFIPQREKDRLETAKRKLEAAKVLLRLKRKSKIGTKKRKLLEPKPDSSYLSESSSDSDN